LNPPLDPARHVVQASLVRLLSAEGIQVDWTEDVTRMTNLSAYRAVIFASPTRDTLWNHAAGAAGQTHLDAARTALRQFIRSGGGFVGIHNAHGTEYNWQYYEGLLGNSNYYNHGANQDGEVVIVNDRDVSTKNLPNRWAFRDEWYNLVPFPTNVNFLAVVDEKTLASGVGSSHPGHGDFHPVSWCQYYDGGKVWITTLGHDRGAFEENSSFPGAAEFQKHIVAGIKSVMGLEQFCQPDGRGRRHDD
jgi:type 1 glutamine amidotransferase